MKKIILLVTLTGLLLLFGCQTSNNLEDPLLTPYSIGPNGPPELVLPTNNPPINE